MDSITEDALLEKPQAEQPKRKRKQNKPRRPWRSRAFVPLFNIDELDPNVTPGVMLRPLEQDEINVLRIYCDYIRDTGNAPKAELKYGIIADMAREMGLKVLPTVEERKASAEPLPSAREHIDHVMFKDFFPHNENIPFTTAAKRLIGYSSTDTSPEECREAVRWLSELLTYEKLKSLPETERAHCPRVIPTTGDIDTAAEGRLVIPALGCPLPTSGTIIRQLGSRPWKDIAQECVGASKKEIRNSLYLKVTLGDLVEDYQQAYAHYFGDHKPGDSHIVTTEQLARFREHGGLGYSRYRTCFSGFKRNGVHIDLNILRQYAGLPINMREAKRIPRQSLMSWTKSEVYAAYMMAWKHLGITGNPPELTQLNDLSLRQTPLFNQMKESGVKSSLLDVHVARAAGVPRCAVPSQQTIQTHFGGINQLIAFAERIQGQPITITGNLRLARLAREAVGLNESQIPSSVIEHMYQRGYAHLEKLPGQCEAVAVRTVSNNGVAPPQRGYVRLR